MFTCHKQQNEEKKQKYLEEYVKNVRESERMKKEYLKQQQNDQKDSPNVISI